jgi:hypothetical protein
MMSCAVLKPVEKRKPSPRWLDLSRPRSFDLFDKLRAGKLRIYNSSLSGSTVYQDYNHTPPPSFGGINNDAF